MANLATNRGSAPIEHQDRTHDERTHEGTLLVMWLEDQFLAKITTEDEANALIERTQGRQGGSFRLSVSWPHALQTTLPQLHKQREQLRQHASELRSKAALYAALKQEGLTDLLGERFDAVHRAVQRRSDMPAWSQGEKLLSSLLS